MRVQTQCVLYYILVAIKKKAYRNVGRNTETNKNDIILVHTTAHFILVHTTAHCKKKSPIFWFLGVVA